MHLDTEKLVELVAEASGIEKEKVEKQLEELIKEIKQVVSEFEAYEIEGFGIFSGIGNRIMFIPNKELETEINFKYVGMEPIELEDDVSLIDDEDDDETNPFDGLSLEDKAASTSTFEGLIEGLDELEEEIEAKAAEEPAETGEDSEEEEIPGPDEWGVEAHKEDESADRLFASLMGEDYTPPIQEEEGIEESSEFDSFGDIFGEEGDSEEKTAEATENLQDELSSLMGDSDEEVHTVSEELMDAGLVDEDADPFEDLLDEISEEDEAIEEVEEALTEELTDEEPAAKEEEIEPSVGAEEEPVEEAEEDSTEDVEETLEDSLEEQLAADLDFEDPFEEVEAESEPVAEKEIIPVIKNLSSKPKKDKKKAEPAEEVLEEEPEKEKKEKKPKKKSTQEPAPLWLWVVLILVVSATVVYGLGYFNIVNIPYVTPQRATVTTPPVQTSTPQVAQNTPPPATTTEPEEVAPMPAEPMVQEQEQEVEPEVTTQEEETPPPVQSYTGEEAYGLTGEPSEAGNDGYSIVLFTLSNQQNAMAQHQGFVEKGYRAMLTPIPSDRYGTLWRVSIGQFATLFDAAVAAEEIIEELPEDYIIKKIN